MSGLDHPTRPLGTRQVKGKAKTMKEYNDWRLAAVKWGFTSVAVMCTAIAIALIVEHDKLSELDKLVTALADGIVRVLTLLLGAGGVAVGAYHYGRPRGGSGSLPE